MITFSADDGAIEQTLERLRVRAPSSLLGRTLAAVGLADAYAPVDTPVGPAFIAFNERGVSAVGLAEDPDAFEARVRRETGRPIHRVDALPDALRRTVERRLAGN